MRGKLHYEKIRVDEASGCWIWTGALRKGYGPHRIWYRRLRGPIPDGLTLDHLCRNIACVNPDHMEPVTNAENIRRGVEARGTWGRPKVPPDKRTGCRTHGTEDGYLKERKDGYVAYVCRVCARKRLKDFRAKKS